MSAHSSTGVLVARPRSMVTAKPIDIRGLLALLALLLPVSASSARQYVDMGAKDDVAAYQPTVPFEVLTNDASETSLGPGIDIDGFGLFGNTLLLDTGASSIIAMNDAETTLRQNGFVTEGQIFEQGVAGFSILDVSAPYKIKTCRHRWRRPPACRYPYHVGTIS